MSDRKPEVRPASAREPTRREPRKERHKEPHKERRQIKLGALEDHLGYYIRRVQVWVFQDFIRTLAATDIRPAQYSVLTVIGANPGLSQSDLADALAIERARLVHLLDKLEKRGLTERQPSPTDRRSHALHLTAEGQKVLKQAKIMAARHEANLISILGEEQYASALEVFRAFGDRR